MTTINMTRSLSELLRSSKENEPEIYREFFQRIYNDDPRFCDWKLPLFFNLHTVTTLILKYGRTRSELIPVNYLMEAQLAAKMSSHQNPLFFVEPELFKACAMTSPLKDISLDDLKLPHSAFSFILPKGALMHKGEDVPFISVARDPKGFDRLKIHTRDFDVTSEDSGLIVSIMMPNAFSTITIRLTDEWLGRLEDIPEMINWQDFSGNSTFDAADNQFANNLLTVTMNLLMAMASRPELVIQERKIKHLRRDRLTEIWAPNILGKKYAIKCEGGSIEKGSHSSPRMHWRRGHFRLQGIGHRDTNCSSCGCAVNMHILEDKERTGCLIADCSCGSYTKPVKAYSETRIVWIDPILGGGK